MAHLNARQRTIIIAVCSLLGKTTPSLTFAVPTAMKVSTVLLVFLLLAVDFIDATREAKETKDARDASLGQRELNRKSNEKPHFVHIALDPFSGNGTTPIPIDSDGQLVEPGSTVILLEENLGGTASYYYKSDYVKHVDIVAVITGSCTVVRSVREIPPQNRVVLTFTSHCNVCVTYKDEQCVESLPRRRELWEEEHDCTDPACGLITATGDIYSTYDVFGNGAGPILLDSKGKLAITGGAHDLNSVIGGIYDMYHDGRWNMVMNVPLTREAACKFRDYEYK